MNVVLLPATDGGRHVAAQLLVWSRADLLAPFCLRMPEDDPACVELVIGGGLRRLPLGDALPLEGSEHTRFVAFYPLELGEAGDEGFADEVAAFLDIAARVLDYDEGQHVTCVMAIAPATDGTSFPPKLFRPDWHGIVVAPEDRPEPGAPNRLGGDDERFMRHATHAAASVAELWGDPSAREIGLLDTIANEPARSLAEPVQVMRSFSRMAELGYIADQIAHTAFDQDTDGWPRPSAERFDRARDPDPLIRHLAAAYFDHHKDTLARRPFRPVEEDEPPRLSLMDALIELWRRTRDWILQRPFEIAEDALAALHDKIAERVEALAGPNSGFRVKRWYDLAPEERGLERLRERIAAPLTVYDGAVMETWTDLRLLLIGLLDGSDVPAAIGGATLMRNGRRLVICDPAKLAHDPRVPADAAPPLPLLEEVRALVVAARERARTDAAALAVPAAAARSDDGPATAARDAGASDDRTETPRRPGPSRLKAAARRVAQYSVAALAASVVALAKLDPLPGLAAFAGIGMLWLAATARYARKAIFRHQVTDDAEARRTLAEINRTLERVQARADVVRLERRCEELDTWIEILAELVHRPWVREPFGTLELPDGLDTSTLPAAFTVGVAMPPPDALERVATSTRARAFQPGWLSSIYQQVAGHAMDEYRVTHALDGAPPNPAEVMEDDDSPARALLAAMKSGAGRRLRENPLAASLLEEIDATPIDQLAPVVVRSQAGIMALPPTTTWVEAPDGFTEVVERVRPLIVAVGDGAVAGVVVSPSVVVTVARHLGGQVVRTASGRTVAASDVTYLSDIGLAILTFDDPLVEYVDLRAAPDIARGDGIVAMLMSRDGVTPTWGFVERVKSPLRIVCDSASPTPGTPVFDLDGRLACICNAAGSLVRVSSIDDLLAGRLTAPPPSAERDDVESEGVTATEFLGRIVGWGRTGGLTPTYWLTSSHGANALKALPTSLLLDGAAAPLVRLTGGATFTRPLRVVVHRLELTKPASPSDLAWCRCEERAFELPGSSPRGGQ